MGSHRSDRAWAWTLNADRFGEALLICSSLLRLLPNLVDNLVNRVLANVLPDLVRTYPRMGSKKQTFPRVRGHSPTSIPVGTQVTQRDGGSQGTGACSWGLGRTLRNMEGQISEGIMGWELENHTVLSLSPSSSTSKLCDKSYHLSESQFSHL